MLPRMLHSPHEFGDWIPALITAVLGSGSGSGSGSGGEEEGEAGSEGYLFVEAQLDANAQPEERPGGLRNIETDPAYPMDGVSVFEEGDVVLVRRAVGGQLRAAWELVAIPRITPDEDDATDGSGSDGDDEEADCGSGCGCGWLALLKPSSCVRLSGEGIDVTLVRMGSTWTHDEPFELAGHEWIASFWFKMGWPRLSLTGDPDGSGPEDSQTFWGVWTQVCREDAEGNPYTTFALNATDLAEAGGSGEEPGLPCDAEVFLLEVSCTECPEPPSVTVPCCETPVPEVLYLTFSDQTGGCVGCLEGTRVLTYDAGSGGWLAPLEPCTCCTAGGISEQWGLGCALLTQPPPTRIRWHLSSISSGASPPLDQNVAVTVSCADPFLLIFEGVTFADLFGFAACGASGGTVTVTISETPP